MKTTILASSLTLTFAPFAAAQCVGDIAVDGRVDGGDLGVLLANWGPVTSTALSRACDLDGSGKVDGADLGMLLANWGSCPVPTWSTVIEAQPDPAVVTNSALRAAIQATGLPWRVRDNGTGIEMMLIPPGTFQMGCIMGSNQYGCYSWEQPVHEVTLTKAFYIGRYEVMQSQWTMRMGWNPSYFQGFQDSHRRPVERVSWNDIQSFLFPTGLRLPTEAEWEYACRAGNQTPFYNGWTDDSTVANLAWISVYPDNQTHAVGGKQPNDFGLYDMLGNVREIVADVWVLYSSAPQVDPHADPAGETGLTLCVERGGSCYQLSDSSRASNRGAIDLAQFGNDLGFRVARNP
jgi:formylglycine-generating enzyme required for sulfatase activity